MSRPRWACPEKRRISGGGAGWPKVWTASTTDRRDRTVARIRRRRELSNASCGCGSGASSGPRGSRASLVCRRRTVHRVLCRHGLNRLAWMDRPTGQVIRRIHTDRPGELVHVDVKKLGRIPPGGGWRAHGRGNVVHASKTKVGYDYIHTAIDAHSRLAYSEILANEKGPTCAAFWERAHQFFGEHAITIDAVLTDNAKNYLGRDFTAALNGIDHRRIRPRRPQTNGKVER